MQDRGGRISPRKTLLRWLRTAGNDAGSARHVSDRLNAQRWHSLKEYHKPKPIQTQSERRLGAQVGFATPGDENLQRHIASASKKPVARTSRCFWRHRGPHESERRAATDTSDRGLSKPTDETGWAPTDEDARSIQINFTNETTKCKRDKNNVKGNEKNRNTLPDAAGLWSGPHTTLQQPRTTSRKQI